MGVEQKCEAFRRSTPARMARLEGSMKYARSRQTSTANI
ncbi:hypothetical protein STAPHY8AQ_70187 [Staphylococcus sp. 8AQ]|nr:hypothetical protein STAPHY8AQ_70187 [Staphylococcus sp. 8AQ]